MPIPIRQTKLRRGDRVKLEQLVRSRTTPQRVVERAKVVLASADGISGNQICAQIGVSRVSAVRWLDRYDAEGIDAVVGERRRLFRISLAGIVFGDGCHGRGDRPLQSPAGFRFRGYCGEGSSLLLCRHQFCILI
jgi:hypothetical protein